MTSTKKVRLTWGGKRPIHASSTYANPHVYRSVSPAIELRVHLGLRCESDCSLQPFSSAFPSRAELHPNRPADGCRTIYVICRSASIKSVLVIDSSSTVVVSVLQSAALSMVGFPSRKLLGAIFENIIFHYRKPGLLGAFSKSAKFWVRLQVCGETLAPQIACTLRPCPRRAAASRRPGPLRRQHPASSCATRTGRHWPSFIARTSRDAGQPPVC